jgi:hypothetical protein
VQPLELEGRVRRAEAQSAEAVERVCAVLAEKAQAADLADVVLRVDSMGATMISARDTAVQMLNALTKSLEAISDFTIRRGSPCLSCGQALPSCPAPEGANGLAIGPGDQHLVTSPDLVSVGFAYSTLQQVCALIFKYAHETKAHAVQESNLLFGPGRQARPDDATARASKASTYDEDGTVSTADSCATPMTQVPAFKVPSLQQVLQAKLPPVKDVTRTPNTARTARREFVPAQAATTPRSRRPSSASNLRRSSANRATTRFATPR